MIIIRSETEADIQAIIDVTKAAFENHPFSQQTEQFIVTALRNAGNLAISLVAEDNGKIIGHIAFSPAQISNEIGSWFALGPISVLPEYQNKGIGSSLLKDGLKRLKTLGARGCVLVGDPKFYERFGFKSYRELTYDEIPQENVMALSFDNRTVSGEIRFHKAFFATK